MDGSLKNKVSLKDKDKSYDLLDAGRRQGSDGKTITERLAQGESRLRGPDRQKLKYLHLTLPAAAFHAGRTTIFFESDAERYTADAAKKPAENAEKADKPGDADSAKDMPKGKAKK